ncbi:death-on-curing protein [Haemophilus parahaemolyticus]|uniref:Death-on-curing protein n=1 Tax=Haemophilus parahaemolyticus TaxID=735 RepID=A0A377HZG3_HAEPH|nr:death-on-curing protein [Haemophilus parahaemolyticus]
MKGRDNLCRLRILKAVIFRTGLDNISLHFKNISNKARLDDNLTTEDFSVVYQNMHILKKDK